MRGREDERVDHVHSSLEPVWPVKVAFSASTGEDLSLDDEGRGA